MYTFLKCMVHNCTVDITNQLSTTAKIKHNSVLRTWAVDHVRYTGQYTSGSCRSSQILEGFVHIPVNCKPILTRQHNQYHMNYLMHG